MRRRGAGPHGHFRELGTRAARSARFLVSFQGLSDSGEGTLSVLRGASEVGMGLEGGACKLLERWRRSVACREATKSGSSNTTTP